MLVSNSGLRGFPFGPSNSATLNSVLVYGNTVPPTGSAPNALGMQVTVMSVPEPSTCTMALAGLVCGGYSFFRRRKRA